jgi:dihydroorotase
MSTYLITNARVINEGKIAGLDVFIKDGIIEKTGAQLPGSLSENVIDLQGNYLMPGIIDDQVHFREPGLTHKATIETESKAAVAGGVTTFMEMPNTVPNALTRDLLEDKYRIASQSYWANYSFFMGASNDNYDEAMRTDIRNVCGLKIFMGSSTGNMLVDNKSVLEKIFANFPSLIATHCEDEATIKANLELYKERYAGKELPYDIHCLIRNEEACYKSSEMAVALAKKHGTRLHILHLSTTEELDLFDNSIPLKDKKLTSELCVHHLYFDADDYHRLGNKIKCNPAIKHGHRDALLKALLDDRLDIIATDHAPHTLEEKHKDYWNSPSGLPLVQHSLLTMLELYQKGVINLEKIVEKMAHAPAVCFEIEKRGFIREGYHADLAAFSLGNSTTVTNENIFYKCGWSPFEGHTFPGRVTHTFVSGNLVYENGKFFEKGKGQRLKFER